MLESKIVIGVYTVIIGFYMIFFSFPSKANSGNEKSLEVKQFNINYTAFIKKTPMSVFLYKGHSPFRLLAASASNKEKEYSDSEIILTSPPNLLPEKNEFYEEVLVGEFLNSFVGVNSTIKNGFDGFRIYQISEKGSRKAQSYFNKVALKKFEYNDHKIYCVPLSGLSYCWDFKEQTIRRNLLCTFLSQDIFMLFTSMGYLNDNLSPVTAPIKVGPAKKIALLNSEFFENSQPGTFQATSFFKRQDILPSEKVCSEIEAIQYSKSQCLYKGPFSLKVITRKDNAEDAKSLFSEFGDRGQIRKSVERVGKCSYILTIYTDPISFYGKLGLLQSVGI